MIIEILFIIILVAVAALIMKGILKISSTLIQITAHFLAGWILLTVVNFLPGLRIPINLITVAISGFGGVVGTVLLAIFYLIF